MAFIIEIGISGYNIIQFFLHVIAKQLKDSQDMAAYSSLSTFIHYVFSDYTFMSLTFFLIL